MLNLIGNTVYLRALEPEDLDFLYLLENSTEIWEVSGTTTPYSKYILRKYLENTHRDIYEVKQLRLCVCTKAGHRAVGLIDLFDFDPKNHRAGVGLVILKEKERNKGMGSEALSLVCEYGFSALGLRQLFANVVADNRASVHLFEKLGFESVGVKKDWIFSEGTYKNEILFQKINA